MSKLKSRDRQNCPECGQECVYKCGEKNKPHWAHLPNQKCELKGDQLNESLNHKYAKNQLCEYLNQNNSILITQKCCQCLEELSPVKIQNVKAIEEYKYSEKSQNKVDIGIFKEDEFNCAIEIYLSHKTDENKREDIIWYELDANEVINNLTNNNNIFKCLRREIKCNKQYCLSIEEIAIKFGYLEINTDFYENECRKIIDMAISGKYKKEERIWNNNCRNYSDISITNYEGGRYWDILKRNEKCIRCSKKNEIQYKRPYCRDCYNHLFRDGNNSDITYKHCLSNKKKQLRSKLGCFMDSLDNYNGGYICSICKRDWLNRKLNDEFKNYWKIGTNHVDCKVWWYGKYGKNGKHKSCCTVCLEANFKEFDLM